MSERIDPVVWNDSQICLNRLVAHELRRRQAERSLSPEELCYLWLAELTVAKIQGTQDEREESNYTR